MLEAIAIDVPIAIVLTRFIKADTDPYIYFGTKDTVWLPLGEAQIPIPSPWKINIDINVKFEESFDNWENIIPAMKTINSPIKIKGFSH